MNAEASSTTNMLETELLENNRKQSRERTMTESTTGSFATYMNHEDETGAADLIRPLTVTVDSVARTVSKDDDDDQIPLERQVQEAQCQAADALDALRQLSEGIQIIARQMKHAHHIFNEEEQPDLEYQYRDRSWSDASYTSDDDRRLSDLSRQLEGALGADLMGLTHAAQMLTENSRMASQEASILVRDVHLAQENCQKAEKRTKKAETAVKFLYKKNRELVGQLEKSKNARNVLKRQVKALLKEKSTLKEQTEVVRVLELHVAKALQAHEQELRHAKKAADSKDGSNVATVRLECQPNEEMTSGKVEADYDEQHFAAVTAKVPTESKETTQSKERSTATPKTVFDAANEASEAKEKEYDKESEKLAKVPKPNRVGFGAAMGFGGPFGMKKKSSWRKKEKSQSKLKVPPHDDESVTAQAQAEQRNGSKKVIDTAAEEEQAAEPALITPVNAAGEVEETRKEQDVSNERPTTPANTIAETVPAQQSMTVSPSPTDSSSLMKGFFHLGNKDRSSRTLVKAPLIQLDEDTVDSTEYSRDCTEPGSVALKSDNEEGLVSPPGSLACDATSQVSPFYHDFARETTQTDLLSENALRSLAVPSVVVDDLPMKKELTETIPLLSPTCPIEIAQIYEELGKLYEC